MTTIVEFLTARLDEDEAAARAATAGPWEDHRGFVTDVGPTGYPYVQITDFGTQDDEDAIENGRPQGSADSAHIARHDPARVLREVEAKRAIVAQHEGVHECPSPRPWSLDGNTDHVTQEECWTLRNLASVYAEHPEYDPAWSVAT